MYHHLITSLERIFKADAHYFISNSFWVAANQVVSILGSLVVTVVFAHFLSEELFGNYRYLVVLASVLAVFSLNGISQSILQTAAQGKIGFFFVGMKAGMTSGILSGGLGLVCATYYYLNDNTLLASGCLIIGLTQPFINNYFNIFSLLSGQKRLKEATLFQTIRVTIITLASLSCIFLSRDVFLLFVTYQTAQLLTNVSGYLYFKPNKRAILPLAPMEEKKYLRFALHQSVQAALLNSAQRLDAILIFQHLGAAQLAFYTIALVIPEQMRGFVKNFSTLLIPKYVHYTPEQLYRSIPLRSIQLFVILVAVTIAYILISPILFSVVFPKYIEAITYTQLLALALPASILFLVQSALKTSVNSRALYFIQITSAAGRTILVLSLTYWLGITGTVYAFVLSAYVELAMYFGWYYTNRSFYVSTKGNVSLSKTDPSLQ